ncbi:MAG: dethiobiotin synthase, partial [Gammaproteobacteria bacterium]|nr:dethiobiotin synthase [Gammaproteobacteria bacterium]
DVGKTYVGAQLVSLLHDNDIKAVPRKPIESGCIRIGSELEPADARHYFEAAKQKYPLTEICPFRFEAAISPQRAARLSNQLVFLTELVKSCTTNVADDNFLIVEGAGGFYSPLCENGKNADLAKKLNLPVLLIANDQLGCINHILLTMEAIANQGLVLIAVILNQKEIYSDKEMNNLEDLETLISVPIYTLSNKEMLNDDTGKSQSILKTILGH